MDIIELKNICKDYYYKDTSQANVLRNINLKIDKGEFIAIKGPSGAGKSTLLHILGCIDPPTSGEYFFEGINVRKINSRNLAVIRNQKIGFILQSFGLILEESAMENIKLPLYFSNIPKKEIYSKAFKILKQFGLTHLEDRPVMNLSGGEKQRIAVARALVNNPEIILADEPTGALDSKNSALLMDILEELNQKNITIVVVTHEEYVANRCKRVINIRDGIIEEL